MTRENNGLFNGQSDNPEDNQGNDQVNYVEEMTKKFRKEDGTLDVEALARGKWESDQHIARIETENHGFRQELNTRLSLEDFMKKMDERNLSNRTIPNNDGEPQHRQQNESITKENLTAEEVQKLIQQTLTQEQKKTNTERNVAYVRQELTKAWGKDFHVKLKQKAQEIGADEKFLASMAESQPRAFLTLVGVSSQEAPRSQPNVSPPNTQVNSTAGLKSPTVRNSAYWKKYRKENPEKYFSVEATRQRFEDAKTLGEDFFVS